MSAGADEPRDVSGPLDAQTMEAERARQERQVGRRVVENRREQAGDPKELRVRMQSEIARVLFHVIEDRDHRPKNAEENPRDLLQGSEREFIQSPDLWSGQP